MTRKHQRKRKTPLLQCGSPVEINVPEAIQASFRINFRDKFTSWFGINNTAPDLEKINKMLPNVLQVKLKKSSSNSGTKKKNMHRQLLVDLNKLEKIASISEKDKKRIRKILEDIKCNRPESKKKPTRKTTRKVNKLSPTLKSSKLFSNQENRRVENENLNNKSTTTNSQINTTIPPKKIKSECKQCLKFPTLRDKPKRKEKIPSTTISISQDQIFKTLIGLDPRCFGDTVSIRSRKHSSTTTVNTVYKDKQNINIKNIELKYVSPTYVVQYNTNEDDEEDRPKARERLFSNAVVEAHLGGPPIQYHQGRARGLSQHMVTPMHYRTSDSEHVVGGGLSDKDQRAEKNKSYTSFLKPRESNSEDELKRSSFTTIPRSPDRGKWQKDPLPSYLLPNEQRAHPITSDRSAMAQKKHNPMCRKCLNFFKRVLCFRTNEKADKLEKKVENPFTKIILKANMPQNATRTTEHEFFNPKVNQRKNYKTRVSILKLPRVTEKQRNLV